MEQYFNKSFDSLEEIFNFLDRCFLELDVEEEARFPVKFAVEEIFTNMVKYNPEQQNAILILLKKNGRELTIQMVDRQDQPFDISKAGGVDVGLPIDQRKPGGLGIFLTKKLLDKVEYEHSEKKSKITLVKNLER